MSLERHTALTNTIMTEITGMADKAVDQSLTQGKRKKHPPVEPGNVYGRLTVIEFEGIREKGKRYWKCKCECGSEVTLYSSSLSAGYTRSCGCLKSETTSKIFTTHGATDTPEYGQWKAMRERCRYVKHKSYYRYGGRGIKVCKWIDADFSNFLALLGNRPSDNHSVDRISLNGHYSCGTCSDCAENGWSMNLKWSTEKEQQNNKSTNRMVTAFGITKTVSQWAEEKKMVRTTLVQRLNSGWEPEVALTKPIKTKPAIQLKQSEPDFFPVESD